MHGKKEKMKKVLLYLWQFPQSLAGVAARCYYRGHVATSFVFDKELNIKYFVVPSLAGNGISFGPFVFVKYYYFDAITTYEHERGHSLQSLYLGPLYLFIIGIPSLLWAIWYKKHPNGSYYSFFTERWADKLAEIKR